MAEPVEHLQGQQVELILRQVDSLPTLPVVATKLAEAATASSQSDTEEVVALIRADQSLTAKLLSLASRADSRLRREARTDREGRRPAGLRVRPLGRAEHQGLRDVRRRGTGQGGMNRASSGSTASPWPPRPRRSPAGSRLNQDPEEVFVCGLLHDLGKLALEHCLPKSYARALEAAESQYGNIADHERHIIGVDHTILGRRLAQTGTCRPPSSRPCGCTISPSRASRRCSPGGRSWPWSIWPTRSSASSASATAATTPSSTVPPSWPPRSAWARRPCGRSWRSCRPPSSGPACWAWAR